MNERANFFSILSERLATQALACIILLIIIGLLTVLLVVTGGNLNDALWYVLYIGLALITGIAFWIIAPGGTGEVTIPVLGIKLVGSAATGAAFIILMHSFLPPRDYAIITLPEKHQDKSFIPKDNDSVELTEISTETYLVKFDGNKTKAKFKAEQIDPDGQGFSLYEFTVDRSGKILDIQKIKERLR
jgi:ABC-type transport system involved in multi-copper enzyme maturation permease subunit